MNLFAKASCLAIALMSTAVVAQDNLVGKYSGRFMTVNNRGDFPISLELTVLSVENGNVTATAHSYGRQCGGDFPMRGTLEGDKLVLKAVKAGGRASDCDLALDLTVQGSKLSGGISGTASSAHSVQLSK
ncbi:MAG: hypothetical protein ACXWCW_26820 [Burkholderiales bacterium]